jgi:hypothetical protein
MAAGNERSGTGCPVKSPYALMLKTKCAGVRSIQSAALRSEGSA